WLSLSKPRGGARAGLRPHSGFDKLSQRIGWLRQAGFDKLSQRIGWLRQAQPSPRRWLSLSKPRGGAQNLFALTGFCELE
ncbi:hypothetical protein, partial [Candidatus Viridilinea mediisalina]